MRQAVVFDDFAFRCQFFNGETEVNNGYGCDHPKQENTNEDEDGNEQGCCFCHSCPLGVEAEQEDIENPEQEINWDGLCKDGEINESEYLLVEVGTDSTEEQKQALCAYERYMHRYDKKWLEEHNI